MQLLMRDDVKAYTSTTVHLHNDIDAVEPRLSGPVKRNNTPLKKEE